MQSKLIFLFATVYNPFKEALEFFDPDLVEAIKPEGMEIEELKKIVGPFYEFNEGHKEGKINVRNN